jgi:hypothetical protein
MCAGYPRDPSCPITADELIEQIAECPLLMLWTVPPTGT